MFFKIGVLKNFAILTVVSKPVKHNKNAGTTLFLLSCWKWQHEKNILRTFFVSVGTQKG